MATVRSWESRTNRDSAARLGTVDIGEQTGCKGLGLPSRLLQYNTSEWIVSSHPSSCQKKQVGWGNIENWTMNGRLWDALKLNDF
jgi:hypothetical protein